MAQGQIRKGFFFYFGLFVLLLISVFMICLVVMIFNPGKTVLWMKYFTGSETYFVEETNEGDAETIDLTKLSEVNIKCSYANVFVKRYRDNNLRQDGLYIINHAKGFAGADADVNFKYKVYKDGSVLNIELDEPDGFLFFSKKIEVLLLSNTIDDDDNAYTFKNLSINVETGDGNVEIGGIDAGSEGNDIQLKGIEVVTDNGNITLGEMLKTDKFEYCKLSTSSGSIRAKREVVDGQTGLKLNCAAEIDIGSGSVGIDMVDVGANELNITSKTGSVDIGSIVAAKTKVVCHEGNYRFQKIKGDLTFDYSENTLKSPNIVVDYIEGNFDISSVGGTPDVTIGEITGRARIVADKGKAVIKKARGEVLVDGEKNFAIDVAFAEGYGATATLINNSENIVLKFLGGFSGDVRAETNKGSVVVKVTKAAGFKSDAFKNSGDKTERLADGQISINVGLNAGDEKNPLTVVGDGSYAGSGKLAIYTNSKIDYQLVDRASMLSQEEVA